MGAYSPVPFIDDTTIKQIMAESIEPTLAELNRRGIDYRGVLYAGLMLTKTGPRLLAVSYTHLRAHETVLDLVCRLLLEKKNKNT